MTCFIINKTFCSIFIFIFKTLLHTQIILLRHVLRLATSLIYQSTMHWLNYYVIIPWFCLSDIFITSRVVSWWLLLKLESICTQSCLITEDNFILYKDKPNSSISKICWLRYNTRPLISKHTNKQDQSVFSSNKESFEKISISSSLQTLSLVSTPGCIL